MWIGLLVWHESRHQIPVYLLQSTVIKVTTSTQDAELEVGQSQNSFSLDSTAQSVI